MPEEPLSPEIQATGSQVLKDFFAVSAKALRVLCDSGFVRIISGARVNATWYIEEVSINEVMPKVVLRPVQ